MSWKQEDKMLKELVVKKKPDVLDTGASKFILVESDKDHKLQNRCNLDVLIDERSSRVTRDQARVTTPKWVYSEQYDGSYYFSGFNQALMGERWPQIS